MKTIVCGSLVVFVLLVGCEQKEADGAECLGGVCIVQHSPAPVTTCQNLGKPVATCVKTTCKLHKVAPVRRVVRAWRRWAPVRRLVCRVRSRCH